MYILKYINTLITVLLIIITAGCSDSTSSSSVMESRSFLWEVTDGSGTVFILGSIHMADESLYPLADSIEDAYGESENVVVEFDVQSVNELQLAKLVLQKARYPAGETLYSNIPKELYEKADDILEDMGADILLFNSYEPWVVAMEIEALQLVQYGYKPENGIDMHFLTRAHQDDKRIYELESADSQIEMMDTFSKELQIFMLENIIDEGMTRKDLEQMFDIWKNGDVNEMERLIFEGVEENREMRLINEKLLDERNFSMVDKIEGFLSDEEIYFVVVGAAHLVGENGLINLLIDEGYQVTQL